MATEDGPSQEPGDFGSLGEARWMPRTDPGYQHMQKVVGADRPEPARIDHRYRIEGKLVGKRPSFVLELARAIVAWAKDSKGQ